MMRGRRLPASGVLAIVLFAATWSGGCVVVPMKMRTRVETAPGATRKFSPKEVAPGRTSRREVEERYGQFAVDTGIPNVFWGRFRKSSWAVGWGTLLPAPYVGGDRIWGVCNLIAVFDADGSVMSSAFVGEGDLQSRVIRMLADGQVPPLAWEPAPRIRGQEPDPENPGGAVDLDLRSDGVVVTRHARSSRHGGPKSSTAMVTAPLADVRSVTVGHGGDNPSSVGVVLRLKGETSVGSDLKFKVDPRDALVLVRWLAQVRAQ